MFFLNIATLLQKLVTGFFVLLHPFYVSVTEINHNVKDKRIEVSCRMFFNDFEAVLEKNYKMQLDIIKPADKKRLDLIIADYVKKHVIIKVDGKALNLTYLGYQIEEDGCWCYLEAVKIPKVKQLEVKNDLLFAEFKTQTNMLQVSANGQEKSTKLDNPESTAVFNW